MTSLVGIRGKQTVQRISIRFPEREGQSRIFQYKTHSLFIPARPLVKFFKEPASGCAKIFHKHPLLLVGYVPNVGERGLPCPTQDVSPATQDMSRATQKAAARMQ